MLLKDKIAVIHGAGGAVGGATARAFARAGATVYMAGRNRAKLDALARDLTSAGGTVAHRDGGCARRTSGHGTRG